MNDPFLADHHVFDAIYLLAGRLSPASIRDQCIRAELLADRLRLYRNLDKRSTVLIVGAGFSGLVVAAKLLQASSCRVIINDIQKETLLIQRKAGHRVVSPYGFDWPYYFYRWRHFPLIGKAVMRWSQDAASRVVDQFDRQLNEITNDISDSRFEQALGTRIAEWRRTSRGKWSFLFEGEKEFRTADAIVLCCENSSQEDKVANFRGFRFWDHNDPFFSASATIKRKLSGKDRVLIVGSGDGALGDFVRLVTGKSTPDQLMRPIEKLMSPSERSRTQALQAFIHRHYLLSSSRTDERIWRFAQRQFDRLARRLWRRNRIQEVVKEKLLAVRSCRPAVQILVRKNYFKQSYTSNRLLVGLLSQALQEDIHTENDGLVPVIFGSQVRRVAAIGVPTPTRGAKASKWLAAPRLEVEISPSPPDPSKSSSRIEFTCILPRIGRANETINPVFDAIERAYISRRAKQKAKPFRGNRNDINRVNALLRDIRQAIPQLNLNGESSSHPVMIDLADPD